MLTADNYRESRGMARGVVRRKDHRSTVAFPRQVFEDDSGGALPEAMQLADRVDDLDRKEGARFRAGLVRMLGEVEPTLAPPMAAGRIVCEGCAPGPSPENRDAPYSIASASRIWTFFSSSRVRRTHQATSGAYHQVMVPPRFMGRLNISSSISSSCRMT